MSKVAPVGEEAEMPIGNWFQQSARVPYFRFTLAAFSGFLLSLYPPLGIVGLVPLYLEWQVGRGRTIEERSSLLQLATYAMSCFAVGMALLLTLSLLLRL